MKKIVPTYCPTGSRPVKAVLVQEAVARKMSPFLLGVLLGILLLMVGYGMFPAVEARSTASLLKDVLGRMADPVEVDAYVKWVNQVGSEVSPNTAAAWKVSYDKLLANARALLSNHLEGRQANDSDARQYFYWAYDMRGGVLDEKTAEEYVKTYVQVPWAEPASDEIWNDASFLAWMVTKGTACHVKSRGADMARIANCGTLGTHYVSTSLVGLVGALECGEEKTDCTEFTHGDQAKFFHLGNK